MSNVGNSKIKGMYFNRKIKAAYVGSAKVFSADEPYYDTVSVPSRSSWKAGYTAPSELMEWGSLSNKVYAKYDGSVTITLYITASVTAGNAVSGTGYGDARIYKNGGEVWRHDTIIVDPSTSSTRVIKTVRFDCAKDDYFQIQAGAVSAGGSAYITTEIGVDFNFNPE